MKIDEPVAIDFPTITPDRSYAAFDEARFKPELLEPVLTSYAAQLLFGDGLSI